MDTEHEPLRARDFLLDLELITASLKKQQSAVEKTLQRELYIGSKYIVQYNTTPD